MFNHKLTQIPLFRYSNRMTIELASRINPRSMKTNNYRFIFFIPILLAGMVNVTHAQIKVGFKAGLNSNSFRPENKVRLFVSRGKVEDNIEKSQAAIYDAKTATNVNKSNIDQRYYRSDISVLGFNAGGYAKYQVLSFLNARAELLYFQQGGTVENYYSLYPSVQHKNVKLTQHTLQIPLVAELGIPGMEESPIQPKLMLGGYYGFTMSSMESYDKVQSSQYEKVSDKSTSNVSSSFVYNQAGFLVGIGTDIKMGDNDLSIEFRYNQNLTIINESGAGLTHLQSTLNNYGGNLRTSTFSFNVGMTLFNF